MKRLAALRTLLATVLVVMQSSLAMADEDVLRDSVGTTLRLLQAGRFEMGSGDAAAEFSKDHVDFNSAEDDRPIHPVVLTKPFYMAETEVTVGQFRQFVKETGYITTAERAAGGKGSPGIVGWDTTPPKDNPRFVATFQQKPEYTWKKPGFEQAETHPVVGVSFEDAKAYCAWLSKKEKAVYRLPTEAEWEYAARAGTRTWFSFGDTYHGVIQKFANVGNVELERAFPDRVRRQWLVDVEQDPADNHVFTAPVGSYAANPWKLHDLYGNAWEWCEDRYLDTYYTQFDRPGYQQVRVRAIDPRNDKKDSEHGEWRVIRGGSWFNAPIQCRSSHRSFFEANDAACFLGFRVVRDASPALTALAESAFEKSATARAALLKIVGEFREPRDGRLLLRFRKDQISAEFAAQLRELDEPVDLQIDGQVQFTGADLALVCLAPQLKGLLLSNPGAKITDKDFSVLEAHPDLEQLQVSETQVLTDALCSHLTGMRQLELLHLHGEGITDAGLQKLPELPHLKSLYLAGTKSTGAILGRLQGAPLENASFQNFHDEHAPSLRKFPALRQLQLSGSPITARTVAELGTLPRLLALDVNRCAQLTDVDFQPLSKCLLLQRLNFEQTAAGDSAVSALSSLNNLTDIRLGSRQLTDAGVRKLCEIISLRSFALLAEAVAVTDAGLRDVWRLHNLHSLEISAPKITGTGLVSLSELPEFRSLTLASSATTDAGLREIARSQTLEQLSIGGWQTRGQSAISDAGLQFVGQARGLKQFSLFRKNSTISDAGIKELQSSRPQLKVNVH